MVRPHVLKSTLHKLHGRFVKVTGKSIGLTTFKKYCLQAVIILFKAKLKACLYETCRNVEEMLTSINKIAGSLSISLPCCQSILDISKATLCTNLTMKCLCRQCKKCGVKLLDKLFKPLEGHWKKGVSWYRWITVEKESTASSKKSASSKVENETESTAAKKSASSKVENETKSTASRSPLLEK